MALAIRGIRKYIVMCAAGAAVSLGAAIAPLFFEIEKPAILIEYEQTREAAVQLGRNSSKKSQLREIEEANQRVIQLGQEVRGNSGVQEYHAVRSIYSSVRGGLTNLGSGATLVGALGIMNHIRRREDDR